MARLTLTGQEILIVDQDERVRRGLDKLFREVGFIVTAVAEPARARDQLANKFFPVALIDLDTPTAEAGIELVRFAKERAPLTEIVVLAGSRTFEAAAVAFRAGATDVIPKSQDAVMYLRERVSTICNEINAKINRDRLLGQVVEVHESFLREMMELSRRVVDLEDKLLSREDNSSPSMTGLSTINMLLVDDQPELAAAVEPQLPGNQGWRMRAVQSGGEALDAATQQPLHILVIKEQLPDLPATMVVTTVKNTQPDVVILRFSPPGPDAVGEVKLVEQSRLITLIPSFTEPIQLVRALEEIREGIKQKARERRYLNVFRRDHLEFLKRFNRLRADLEASGIKKKEG